MEGVRLVSWSSGRSWSWRKAEEEVCPSDYGALSSDHDKEEEVEAHHESHYESWMRREPAELSCAQAGLWLGVEVEASDWPEQAEGAERGCGSGCCWRRCVSCAVSCVSGAALARLCGTARLSGACRGVEEGARAFLPSATCLMRKRRKRRGGLTLCLAWVGGVFLCCASVTPSDWLAEVAAGHLIGG